MAADSAYGQDRKLRAALERRRIPYVMAVPVDETVSTHGTGPLCVDKSAAGIPLIFERRSCGVGAKGLRSYDWALADVTWPGGAEGGPRRGHVHLLLVRRSITDPGQVACFAVHAKAGTPIGEIVRVMGLPGESRTVLRPRRMTAAWTTTRSAPGTPGTATSPFPRPPSPSSRSPTPAAATSRSPTDTTCCPHRPTLPRRPKRGRAAFVEKLIRYTAEETRRLLNRLVWATTPPPLAIVIIQSRWRRTHQARAQRCHYATRDKRVRESRL
ncbi:hypothetical protein ABZ137_05850 [Streptomyces bobili]